MPLADGTPISDSSSSNSCNTLSAGSAAFILIALALGTLAQPPGSLVVIPRAGYWRICRLSPLLCGLEGMTILFFLVKAPFEHVSQRKRAFTIMAKRTTTAHDDTRSLVDYLERPKLELILPMMLQFLKAMIIHGSTITTVMAAMYWIDWAMVQYCHCWVYFRPITNEESTCENTIHHGFKGDPICERGWGLQEEAANSIDVFASPEANDGLRWPLELCIIFTVGGFFLEPLFGGSADSAEMFVILLAAYTGIGSFVIFVWFDRLEVKYHLEGIGFALFTAYTVLFEFSLILIYYKFAYQEAGTYKPGWLDWLG